LNPGDPWVQIGHWHVQSDDIGQGNTHVCFVGPIIVWCRIVSDQCVFPTGWAWVLVNQARHEYCFLRIRRLAPVYSIYTVGDCKQFRAMWIFDHGARFFSPVPESGVTFVVNGLYCFRRVHVMSTAWWLFCTSIIGRAILRQCGFECTSSGEIKCFKTDSRSQFYFV
jgi:hypothetical protein